MSLYSLLGIHPESTAYDIENAGKAFIRKLNIGVVKQILNHYNISHTKDDLVPMMVNIKNYINTSVEMLLEPATKDCYDSIIKANTPAMQTLAAARVSYLNSQDGMRFDNSIYSCLPKAKDTATLSYCKHDNIKKPNLPCRWCTKPFELSEYAIYQCKCSARIGHGECAIKFAKEYKFKCPVCRSKLLPRVEISKYMFWGIEHKFKI